jgi:hypothetical protein
MIRLISTYKIELMCLECHFKISKEEIVRLLSKWKRDIDDGTYKFSGSTSLTVLLYSANGIDGEEARHIALQIFASYIAWKKTNSEIHSDIEVPGEDRDRIETIPDLEETYNKLKDGPIMLERTNGMTPEEYNENYQQYYGMKLLAGWTLPAWNWIKHWYFVVRYMLKK